MDADSQTPSGAGHLIPPPACAFCSRILVPDNDDFETFTICGDCKFLLLEDLGTPTQDSRRRRLHRGRRTRYSSSDSMEDLFSQQLSHIINLARQNHATLSVQDDQSLDGDASSRVLPHTGSRTTPGNSRRWRRVLSDTESEGLDNLDSLYGESETSLSFSRYRLFNGESDTISFSAYGGDSDASVDSHSLLDAEIFIRPDGVGYLFSDTDIDPMHAGLDQWNSDDQEEEEEEEDGEWEEADVEEDAIGSMEAAVGHQNFHISSPSEGNWHQQFRWRIRQGIETFSHDILTNLEDSEFPQYIGNSGDYLDARGFEELLESLAETDSSRRGAPPASFSFVNNLPHVIINKEHGKHGDLACAICKDVLTIGAEVNQLPCLHLYHPFCILPWLNARNSCPLCRYELPTDDKDYEEGKQNASGRIAIQEIQQQDVGEDSSDGAEGDETHEPGHSGMEQRNLRGVDPAIDNSSREEGTRRWFFLAAAPIVSVVGIVLVLWLGNPQQRGTIYNCNFPERGLHQIHNPSSSPPNQRGNRSQRWWSFF